MKERYSEKIRNQKGMTLSEVLIAVLLLSLATGIIAGCISLGTRLFRRELQVSQAQMLMDSLTVSIEDELRYATGIHNVTGTVSDGCSGFAYSSRNRAGEKECILLTTGDGHIVVSCRDKEYELAGRPLYRGVTAKLTSAVWEPDTEEFSVTITISDAKSGKSITSKDFIVGAFNGSYNLK